jgi:hypothetical protein
MEAPICLGHPRNAHERRTFAPRWAAMPDVDHGTGGRSIASLALSITVADVAQLRMAFDLSPIFHLGCCHRRRLIHNRRQIPQSFIALEWSPKGRWVSSGGRGFMPGQRVGLELSAKASIGIRSWIGDRDWRPGSPVHRDIHMLVHRGCGVAVADLVTLLVGSRVVTLRSGVRSFVDDRLRSVSDAARF